jgi:hypothetical protein
VLLVLQLAQAISIPNRVATTGEGSFRLSVFSGIPASHREKIKIKV